MTVKLSTGEWDVFTQPFAGLTCEERVIVIDVANAESEKDLMDTFIHETLHASCPRMSEAEVARVAGDLTTVLWKARYRRAKASCRK